ncbi:hemolysin family protein [Tepidimonas sp.]|uniref:hemolysin family protein n=1 Tax=Tepidimonas sp. TaxID=2002775 RepID=UPI00391A4A96
MDILLIVFLTLLNGAFAMSELALAASRRARLSALADAGDKGARTALQLLDNPTQFLSSVQVGITSIGMLNGIVGEAAFSDDLAAWLRSWGWSDVTASVSATAIVVAAITFLTIVFGELVPKRIGQLYPEAVARWVARPMAGVARVAKPFVLLLSATTHGVLRLLRIDTGAARTVTEEEIHASLREGLGAGVIERQEHRMVRNVLSLDDRQLGSLMVPRSDIDWLEAGEPLTEVLRRARQSGHSWYPVCRGGLDHVQGVVALTHLMALDEIGGHETDWARDALPATFVPETLSGLELLEQFRARAMRMVFVVDEYGVVQGMLTPLDLLEAITGELSADEPQDAWATPLPDGSWRVDGSMPAHELKARLEIDALPDEDKDRYHTVAGLMLMVAGRLLTPGERVEIGGWVFEVRSTEGRRIDEVLIRPLSAAAPPPSDGGPAATP